MLDLSKIWRFKSCRPLSQSHPHAEGHCASEHPCEGDSINRCPAAVDRRRRCFRTPPGKRTMLLPRKVLPRTGLHRVTGHLRQHGIPKIHKLDSAVRVYNVFWPTSCNSRQCTREVHSSNRRASFAFRSSFAQW